MFIYKWDSVYIIYVERCLCFAPLLDKQASAKKSGKSLTEGSPDKAGSLWKVVLYCIIIVSLCIMRGVLFNPQNGISEAKTV